MTVVLAFGSEVGDSTEVVTLTGTVDLNYTGLKRTGNKAARFNPAAASANLRCRGSAGADGAPSELGLDDAWATACAYWVTETDASFVILDLTNSANGSFARVLRTTGGVITFQYTDGADTLQTVVNTMSWPTGKWINVELNINNVASAGGASVECRINGVVYGSASGLTLRSASRVIDRTNHGNGAVWTGEVILDDVVVDNAAYLGQCGIEPLFPNAAGSEAEWTTGTGSTFAEVDEAAPDGDTSYIATSTNNRQSSFAMANSSAKVQDRNILATKHSAVIRDEGGVSAIQLRIRSGATIVDTTSRDPGATYVLSAQYRNTDLAGGTIEKADIDAYELGVDCAAGVASRCTQLLLQVIYSDPPSPPPFKAKRPMWPARARRF